MQINYQPAGIATRAFHMDDSFVRGVRGPIGSGKSSACCWEIVYRALKQHPYNGVRSSRWAVIRNTFPELKSTTIRTWNDWFGDVATMKWDSPITSHMKIKDIGDGTGLDLEILFLAIDRPEDVNKLKSLEVTGAWLNEACELPKEVLDVITSRVGRFPSKRNGGFNWNGVILDTNSHDDDNWYYKVAAEETPKGWKFFDQAGALIKAGKEYIPNPAAENIFNHVKGYDYYLDLIQGKTEDWIKVFVLNEYGATLHGKPVFPEWNEGIHLAKEDIKPIKSVPLILAFDFGLTPACAVMQLTPNGQLIMIRELWSDSSGIRQFYQEQVEPMLANEFKGFKVEATGDPAGTARAQTDERSCMDELYSMGMPCIPASTNDFVSRRESVAYFLNRLANGRAGFLLDPSCRMTRKAMNGGYRYERINVGGNTARYKDKPCKDIHSHISDAIQYGCMYIRGENRAQAARNRIKTADIGFEAADGQTGY